MTDEALRWQARHFDGETPATRNVGVGLEPGALIVAGNALEERRWPLESVVIVNGGGRSGPVQLELRGERTEALVVTGPGFLAALRAAGGERKVKRLDTSPVALRVVLALTVAAVAVLFATWRWGVPALAAQVAEQIPASWERELGAAVLQEVAPESVRVHDPVVLRPVEDAFNWLVAAVFDLRDPCVVHVIRSPDANAYAVPGGHVVITTAMLRLLDGPEELSAVLAHEITHVTERHTTRDLLQRAGLGLIVGLMSGNDSAFGRIVGAAGTIGQLSYSRDDETEADAGAAALLARTGTSPIALARAFERLSALESKRGGPRLEFLSTHPTSAARQKRARELAESLVVARAQAPPDTASWRAMDKALARVPDLVGAP
jgi:beta-barrel assembly-enhancing protease